MADSARDPTMDPATLYREEIYTDRKVGTLRVMVPVTTSGASDPSRATIYTGEAQLMMRGFTVQRTQSKPSCSPEATPCAPRAPGSSSPGAGELRKGASSRRARAARRAPPVCRANNS